MAHSGISGINTKELTSQNMNEENDHTDPVTDLGLDIGYYSNQCSERKLNNDSGAGANAGSMVGMAFVPTDPLSELVWSPHKGLSLKCADSNFSNKKTSMFWGIGPSNMTLSRSQSIKSEMSPTNKALEDENLVNSQSALHLKNNPEVFPSSLQKQEPYKISTIWKQNGVQSSFSFLINAGYVDKQIDGIASTEEDKPRPDLVLQKPLSMDLTTKDKDVEVTARMDDALAFEVSASAMEAKNSNQQNEKTHSIDKTFPADSSPTNSGICMKQRKGKEKTLSDGDVDGRTSKCEDDSHESVESCSSVGFSIGKKRCSFENQLIVGGKRVENHINDTPGSTSRVGLGQDSSFMNWISNMMKGFSKSVQDKSHPLALTLEQPENEPDKINQEFITCKKSYDTDDKSMGFQSIFRSLYGLNTKVQEATTHNATPIACHGENRIFGKQFLLTSDKFDESGSVNGAVASIEPNILSLNATESEDLKNSCNFALAITKDKGGISSNCTRGKRKRNSSENVDPDVPSEVKTNHNFGNSSDPLKSLWITRLSMKASGPMLRSDDQNQNNKEHFSGDANTVGGKQLQRSAADPEFSSGLNKYKGHKDQKSIYKLNPRSRSSEAIASVFARRLDALKHIPSDVKENRYCEAIMTCFFCGTSGHHLQDCTEISVSEVKDLSRNISLCNGAAELNCLCIRCFQFNHWAISCPSAPSRARHLSESGNGLISNVLFQTGVCTLYGCTDLKSETDLNVSDKISQIKKTSEKPESNEDTVQKCFAYRHGEKKQVEENEMVPFSSFVGVFDAIKKLQLSRTDILKWMNSPTSPSQLDGFFLRVRLRKWEAGLGGTGYYVAFITGTDNARNSISVNVGGIECLVQSQYISNHDFLEDELMAWWNATTKDGRRVPIEEDLRAKVKKKQLLGL